MLNFVDTTISRRKASGDFYSPEIEKKDIPSGGTPFEGINFSLLSRRKETELDIKMILADIKHAETREHSKRTAEYTKPFVRAINLFKKDYENLSEDDHEIAAACHDIGKNHVLKTKQKQKQW